MADRYVQHISGVGAKWALAYGYQCNDSQTNPKWVVEGKRETFALPKSEYVECKPPVRWERVKVKISMGNLIVGGDAYVEPPYGCRWVLDGEVIYLERQVKG